MKNIIISLVLSLGLVSVVAPAPAFAAICTGSGAACIDEGAGKAVTGSDQSDEIGEIIKIVTNALLFIIGAVSVIYIVIGGMKYATANGSKENIESAKNTIFYAVIGLVAAICAYAIVTFVIDIF